MFIVGIALIPDFFCLSGLSCLMCGCDILASGSIVFEFYGYFAHIPLCPIVLC